MIKGKGIRIAVVENNQRKMTVTTSNRRRDRVQVTCLKDEGGHGREEYKRVRKV